MGAPSAQRGTGLLARGALLVLALYFAQAALLKPLARPYAYSDFATFYSAARCFAEHRDPYDFETLRGAGAPSFGGWIGRYFYPPPFAACCVRPLLALPFGAARRLWVLVEAAAYLTAALLLVRSLFPHGDPAGPVLVGALVLPYAPFVLDLRLGSVSGLLLLLLVIFVREWEKGRLWRAALALAAALVLKLTPGLVVAYLLWRGEWRLSARIAACGAAILLVCLPWTGVQPYAAYARVVLPYLSSANFSWFTNQSADAFFWRLFVPNPDTTPWVASPVLYRACTWSVTALLLAGIAWLGLRARRAPGRLASREWWEVACVLVAGLLLARVTWEYMVVLALPAFALWVREAARGDPGRRETLVVAAAFALCALPFPYAESPLRSGIGLLFESPRSYGLVLLFAATLAKLLRAPARGGLI
jgi:hypothetical protein